MLANKIDFDEKLVTFADWGAGEKARVIAEENPAGHLPVVKINGKPHPEAIAICRYLARKVCNPQCSMICILCSTACPIPPVMLL